MENAPATTNQALVIGGGPSARVPVGGSAPEVPAGCYRIGVNHHWLGRWDVDCMVSCDHRFGLHLARMPGRLELYRCSEVPKLYVGHDALPGLGPHEVLVRQAGHRGISQSFEAGIYTGGNSGFAAIQVAMVLGARKIYLLGFDGAPPPRGTYLENQHRNFRWLAHRLDELGVDVVNLNQENCLDFKS